MGYDLYWSEDPDEENREQRLDAFVADAESAAAHGDYNPLEWMSAAFRLMEEGGSYFRAGIHIMHSYCEELRVQGAGCLADAIEWDSGASTPHVPPELISEGLTRVSVEPTRPPDHEHMSPLENALLESDAPMPTTARDSIAGMPWEEWTARWGRFVTFLAGAAAHGGLVVS